LLQRERPLRRKGERHALPILFLKVIPILMRTK
jgi:hypothetical protein